MVRYIQCVPSETKFLNCELEVLKIVKIVLWVLHFVHKEGIFINI